MFRFIQGLCWPNVLHFYALFQTTRPASTEKQSWVGLSHFWKTYTLYLFAICDTDLQSACHIFGRLTGAEIWLGDQEERKCRCGRKIKTQSDIFLQTQQTKQATVSYQMKHPKNYSCCPMSHIIVGPLWLPGIYNCSQSSKKWEKVNFWIFRDVWCLMNCIQGKSVYGVKGAWKGWWELVWKLHLHPITHAFDRPAADLHKICFSRFTFTKNAFLTFILIHHPFYKAFKGTECLLWGFCMEEAYLQPGCCCVPIKIPLTKTRLIYSHSRRQGKNGCRMPGRKMRSSSHLGGEIKQLVTQYIGDVIRCILVEQSTMEVFWKSKYNKSQ